MYATFIRERVEENCRQAATAAEKAGQPERLLSWPATARTAPAWRVSALLPLPDPKLGRNAFHGKYTGANPVYQPTAGIRQPASGMN